MNTGDLFAAVAICICASHACADVTVMGTRIIYPEYAKSVSIQLNNVGEQPALVQAWLDQGNPKEIPESDVIPFILTPTLSRIEAQKGQKLRLIFKPTFSMPQDRESLYWFNVLDIPPTRQATVEQNQLSLSVRSRLKIFYRPKNLNITPQKSYASLVFQYVAPDSKIVISNPSPYYITLNRLLYSQQGSKQVNQSYLGHQKKYYTSMMLAPFSSEDLKASALGLTSGQDISYEVINDSGGYELFSTQLK